MAESESRAPAPAPSLVWLGRLAIASRRLVDPSVVRVRPPGLSDYLHCRSQGRPVLVRHGAHRVPLDQLIEVLGDPYVRVRVGDYVSAGLRNRHETRLMALSTYVDSDPAAGPDDLPPYAGRHQIDGDHHGLLRAPEVASGTTDLGSPLLWVGHKGARTGLHVDIAHNFVWQLDGTKVFYVLPPHAIPWRELVWANPRLAKCTSNVGVPSGDVSAERVHLSPGDVLYLPPGWFHETEVTSLGATVNFFEQPLPVEVSRGTRPYGAPSQ